MSSTRTGESASANRSMIFCCRVSESAAVHELDLLPVVLRVLVRPSRPGRTSCSHSRVGTDSEKTTARVPLRGPTPISFSVRDQVGELGRVVVGDLVGEVGEAGERRLLGVVGAVLRALAGGLREGLVAGQERLEQGVGEQPPVGCPRPGAWPGSASQVRVSSAKTASSAGDAGQRIGTDGPRSFHLPPISLVTSRLILVRRM